MTRLNGDALRAIRKRTGLTAAQLADLVAEKGAERPHPDSIYNIERGKRGAGDDLIKAIAAALKVPQTAILADPEGGKAA